MANDPKSILIKIVAAITTITVLIVTIIGLIEILIPYPSGTPDATAPSDGHPNPSPLPPSSSPMTQAPSISGLKCCHIAGLGECPWSPAPIHSNCACSGLPGVGIVLKDCDPMPTGADERPSPSISFAKLDESLKKFVDANIAFQMPTEMKLSQAERVSVSLGIGQGREELESIVRETIRTGTAKFVIESSIIKVSGRMAAELNGLNFDIVPSGPQVQYISAVETNNWTWQVKAKLEGDQILDLTLSAIIQIDDKDINRKINTFHKTISVKVTSCEDATSCLKQVKEIVTDSKEIIAGALIPIVAFLVAWFRKRHKNSRTKKRRAT